MDKILVSFILNGNGYFIDQFGQVWIQRYLVDERKIEVEKIGQIDLNVPRRSDE